MNLILFREERKLYALSPDDYRAVHLKKVLRAVPGDTVRVGVVNGRIGTGVVQNISDREVAIQATWPREGAADSKATPGRNIVVLLGHPRPPVLRRLWRDLASLAIREIRVFSGELGERSYLTSSVWDDPDQYLIDGLSQGAHTALPRVSRHENLRRAIAMDAMPEEPGDVRLFGGIGMSDTLSVPGMISRIGDHRRIVICIGPERGLSPPEETLLRAHAFHAVTLGANILRTETATILLAGLVAALRDAPS